MSQWQCGQQMHRMFWAKAQPTIHGDTEAHPLVAHALDVAAVATTLDLNVGMGMEASTLRFLVALHDIGKLSRPS